MTDITKNIEKAISPRKVETNHGDHGTTHRVFTGLRHEAGDEFIVMALVEDNACDGLIQQHVDVMKNTIAEAGA